MNSGSLASKPILLTLSLFGPVEERVGKCSGCRKWLSVAGTGGPVRVAWSSLRKASPVVGSGEPSQVFKEAVL